MSNFDIVSGDVPVFLYIERVFFAFVNEFLGPQESTREGKK